MSAKARRWRRSFNRVERRLIAVTYPASRRESGTYPLARARRLAYVSVVISIRGVTSDEWQEWRLLRRQALDEAPYAFGSTLAEWSGARDCEQRWRQRLEAVPVNLVADQDYFPVGMVSVTGAVHGVVEIISMWVAPSARGRGVGDALIQAALDHARAQGATQVDLDVAPGNEYAINLYRRAGFADAGSATSPNGPRPDRRMELGIQQVLGEDPN